MKKTHKKFFLKSTIKITSSSYGVWLIHNDVRSTVCCLGRLRLVGASDLISCETLLKFSVMYSIPSLCNTFSEVQEKREQSPLLGTDLTHPHTLKDTQTLTQTHNTAFFRLTQIQSHATDIQKEENTRSKKVNI